MAEFSVKYKKTQAALRKKQKAFRGQAQEDLGEFLDEVRKNAADEIMLTVAGGTYFERMKVKSRPGKLTSRTGRMRYLLKEKKGSWKGKGRITYKKDTSAFKMMAKVIRTNKVDKGFIATIKVFISSIPSKVAWVGAGKRKMPYATKRTLKMRFSWEYRGRPVFHPAAKMKLNQLRYKLQLDIDNYLGGVL
jgi:hypothetical protein